jgi:hypothetical protein
LALGGAGGGTIDSSISSWRMVIKDLSFYEYQK